MPQHVVFSRFGRRLYTFIAIGPGPIRSWILQSMGQGRTWISRDQANLSLVIARVYCRRSFNRRNEHSRQQTLRDASARWRQMARIEGSMMDAV